MGASGLAEVLSRVPGLPSFRNVVEVLPVKLPAIQRLGPVVFLVHNFFCEGRRTEKVQGEVAVLGLKALLSVLEDSLLHTAGGGREPQNDSCCLERFALEDDLFPKGGSLRCFLCNSPFACRTVLGPVCYAGRRVLSCKIPCYLTFY